jgi:hypothetical protein
MKQYTISTETIHTETFHTETISTYIIHDNKYDKYTINVPTNINNKTDMLNFLYSNKYIINTDYNIIHASKQCYDILPESIFESSIIVIQNNLKIM